MCPTNNNNIYIKIALATLFAIIVGIVAGIIWPDFFTNAALLLGIELITSVIILGFIALYFIFRTQRSQISQTGRNYFRYLLFGTIGSYILSVIGLSTTLTASLLSSIILGTAIAFFVVMIIGVVFVLSYAIKNAQ